MYPIIKKFLTIFINQRVAKKFLNKFTFTDFYSTTVDSSYWHFGEDDIQQNTIDSFISLTFKYTFRSERLNFLIPFTITIGKNLRINNYFEINERIPECILKDSTCNIMIVNKAMEITFNDKFAPTKYYVEICRPLHRKDYYWIISKITGKKPDSDEDYLGQMKIVNANNGHVISWKQYLAPE